MTPEEEVDARLSSAIPPARVDWDRIQWIDTEKELVGFLSTDPYASPYVVTFEAIENAWRSGRFYTATYSYINREITKAKDGMPGMHVLSPLASSGLGGGIRAPRPGIPTSPASTPPGRSSTFATLVVGDEHATFGKLIAVNSRGGEAKFEKEGSRVILSNTMLVEVADALERAGVNPPGSTVNVHRSVGVNPDEPMKNPYEPAAKPTAADAMQLILEEVKGSSDPLVAAGEWLMKLTNAITAIAREDDPDA